MNLFKNAIIWPLILCISVISCDDSLNISPPSEFSNEFIKTEEGVNSVLNSAYNNVHYNGFSGAQRIYITEATTDVLANYRGFLNRRIQSFMDFNWNSQNPFIADHLWNKPYSAIRDANVVLENVKNVNELSQEESNKIKGEAKFIRALAYTFLYNWFGPVPLVTKAYESSKEDLTPARANEQELLNFIESELKKAAGMLPLDQPRTGKATKGAALGTLTKFYLQTKQWSKAAEAAKKVMDLGKYELIPDYFDLWALDNESNKEMIYVFPVTVESHGNIMIRDLLPPKYPTGCQISATQIVMPVEFYNTYEPADKRNDMFITEYTTTDGEHINLLEGKEFKNPRVRKGPLDPGCTNVSNRDMPYLRYADILLSRAEALVMSTGSVSQEALNLLNQIRNRAGLSDLTMSDVPNKRTFIDTLLSERAKEFIREGKRREDLIRHDRYIQNAKDRGISNAQEFRRRFPIPQSEIDANRDLEQNPGY